jgi:hypothetical protein
VLVAALARAAALVVLVMVVVAAAVAAVVAEMGRALAVADWVQSAAASTRARRCSRTYP